MITDWPSIETAPKDGTWILLAGGCCEDDGAPDRPVVARWTTRLNCTDDPRFGRWQYADFDGGAYGTYLSPQRWHAIDPPPGAAMNTSDRRIIIRFEPTPRAAMNTSDRRLISRHAGDNGAPIYSCGRRISHEETELIEALLEDMRAVMVARGLWFTQQRARPAEETATMDNQHQQIKGYRDLSQAEIDAMNEAKDLGEELGNLIAKLRATPGVDHRWINEGEMQLKLGIMCLVRCIARPTTF